MKLVLIFLCLIGICCAETQLATYSDNQQKSFDVKDYGAKSDGATDNTNAFLKAWQDVCSSSNPAVLTIGKGRYFVGTVCFSGPCKNHVTVQVLGTIVASNSGGYGCKDYWIEFKAVNGLTIDGGGQGVFDGRGSTWWSRGSKTCGRGPTTLRFMGTTNTIVRGITSLNSKQFHIDFDNCKHVRAEHLTIRAPAESPNTDGVHIEQSSDVRIFNIHVGTGDDCVSLGPGSSDIEIRQVTCGPGHGISVGSLGKDNAQATVHNVTVSGVIFKGTQNGVRIKTWEGGKGLATGLLFENLKMKNVKNPIIIDQHYCPEHSGCSVGGSGGVKINDVTYRNITGISATNAAIDFACNQNAPCQGIKLVNVDLSLLNGGQAKSVCKNAMATALGIVKPPTCL